MNEENKHRRDLATVLVRFAGVYFTYQAVTKAIAVPYALFWLASLRNTEFADRINIGAGTPGIISFLVTTGIAYYLLAKGGSLIDFICRDYPNKKQKVDPDAGDNA